MIDWEGDFLVQQPPGILDWLNAVQFAVAWLGQLVLYVKEHYLSWNRDELKLCVCYQILSRVDATATSASADKDISHRILIFPRN